MGSSPKTQTTTSKTEPWDGAKQPLLDLYGRAQEAFDATNKNPYTGQLSAAPNIAQQSAVGHLANNNFAVGSTERRQMGMDTMAAGQQGFQDANKARGFADTLSGLGGQVTANTNSMQNDVNLINAQVPGMTNAANTYDQASQNVMGLGGDLVGQAATLGDMGDKLASGYWLNPETNPYLKTNVDTAMGQVTDNFNRTVMPNISDAAIAGGAYGGSRNGIATGLAASETDRNMREISSQMYGANYEAERGRMMQAGDIYGQGAGLLNNYAGLQTAGAELAGGGANIRNLIAGLGQASAGVKQGMNAGYGQAGDLTTGAGAMLGQAGAIDANAAGLGTAGGQMLDATNAQELQAIQGLASAGQQQQAWDQAALDDAYAQYQLQQQAPWTGMAELSSILHGGSFQNTETTAPNPNYRSPLQTAMGGLGMLFGMM